MGRRHPARHDARRQQRVQRQAQPKARTKNPVQPVVAVDRDADRGGRGDERHGGFVPAEDPIQASCHEHGIRDVEADEGEQRSEQHDDHAAIAELSARLDHLRHSELGALRGVEGNEQGAEQDAQRAGERGEPEAQAHARPDETDRDREKMEIPEEPERHLIDDPAVPLILGDVIDRFALYCHLFRIPPRAIVHQGVLQVLENVAVPECPRRRCLHS